MQTGPHKLTSYNDVVTRTQISYTAAPAVEGDLIRVNPGRALTLIQRRTPDGYIWVYQYSAALDDALRAIVRDGRATDSHRLWAQGVLRSWGIALDPALYPFVAQLKAKAVGA